MQKLLCVAALYVLRHSSAQQWPVAYDVNESLPVLDISLGPPVHQLPESAQIINLDAAVGPLQVIIVAAQIWFLLCLV